MRLLLPLAVSVLALTGCSQAQEAVGTARDCTALAREVARTDLSRVPTPQEAEQAVQRLDDRVQELGDTRVRDAATALRDRLRDVQAAVADADPAAVQAAVADAQDAVRDTAEACGLPVSQFLG